MKPVMAPLSFIEQLKVFHRAWRYRLNSEKESVQYLLRQNLAGTTAVDIGGNRGIYSYWMSRKVENQGAVVVFEPQPELAEYLNRMRLSFQLDNLTIVNKALSFSSGQQVLYRSKVGDGGAGLVDDRVVQRQGIPVEVTTLDEYFFDWKGPKISFIKCDVEGHELAVFEGARDTLLKHFPILLFECHHKDAEKGELFSFLCSLGYGGFFFREGQAIHYSRFNEYPYSKAGMTHRNYIFVRDH